MKRLEKAAAMAFGFAFLALAGAVAAETFLRKVFNRSLQGVDELGGYILAVGAALAFAVAFTAQAHIRIDVIHERLPRPLRVFLNVLAMPALAACALSAVTMAWFALQDSIQFNSTAQTPWATPLYLPQSSWVVALALFALLTVVGTLRVFGLLATGKGAEIDRRYGPRGAKAELEEELADLKARGGAGPAA